MYEWGKDTAGSLFNRRGKRQAGDLSAEFDPALL
jgi:hypothetical protein